MTAIPLSPKVWWLFQPMAPNDRRGLNFGVMWLEQRRDWNAEGQAATVNEGQR